MLDRNRQVRYNKVEEIDGLCNMQGNKISIDTTNKTISVYSKLRNYKNCIGSMNMYNASSDVEIQTFLRRFGFEVERTWLKDTH